MTIVRNREGKPETDSTDSTARTPAPAPDHAHPDYEYIGEVVDHDTAHKLALAFRTVEKFPEFVKRHRRFVGGAAATAVVSTTAIILAYRAVHARVDKGESAAEALRKVTEEEIERSVSLFKRIRKGKK